MSSHCRSGEGAAGAGHRVIGMASRLPLAASSETSTTETVILACLRGWS